MIKRLLEQSPIRRKVLRFLAEHPQDRFSITQLQKQIDCAKSSLQKELGFLATEGHVLKIEEGHRHYFQANTASKHHKEIKGILAGWVEPPATATKARGRGRPRQNHIKALEAECRRLQAKIQALEAELAAAKAAIKKAPAAAKPVPKDDEIRVTRCAQCLKEYGVKVGWSGLVKECPHCRHSNFVPDYRSV